MVRALESSAVHEPDLVHVSSRDGKETASLDGEFPSSTICCRKFVGSFETVGLPVDKVDVVHGKFPISKLNSQNVS